MNKLYSEKINEIELYLPQLCFLAFSKNKREKSLVKFLLDISVEYSNFGVKAMMYLSSYSEDEEWVFRSKSAELLSLVEIAIVNNEVPDKFRAKVQDDEKLQTEGFQLISYRDIYK